MRNPIAANKDTPVKIACYNRTKENIIKDTCLNI